MWTLKSRYFGEQNGKIRSSHLPVVHRPSRESLPSHCHKLNNVGEPKKIKLGSPHTKVISYELPTIAHICPHFLFIYRIHSWKVNTSYKSMEATPKLSQNYLNLSELVTKTTFHSLCVWEVRFLLKFTIFVSCLSHCGSKLKFITPEYFCR